MQARSFQLYSSLKAIEVCLKGGTYSLAEAKEAIARVQKTYDALKWAGTRLHNLPGVHGPGEEAMRLEYDAILNRIREHSESYKPAPKKISQKKIPKKTRPSEISAKLPSV